MLREVEQVWRSSHCWQRFGESQPSHSMVYACVITVIAFYLLLVACVCPGYPLSPLVYLIFVLHTCYLHSFYVNAYSHFERTTEVAIHSSNAYMSVINTHILNL